MGERVAQVLQWTEPLLLFLGSSTSMSDVMFVLRDQDQDRLLTFIFILFLFHQPVHNSPYECS